MFGGFAAVKYRIVVGAVGKESEMEARVYDGMNLRIPAEKMNVVIC